MEAKLIMSNGKTELLQIARERLDRKKKEKKRSNLWLKSNCGAAG